MLIAGPSASGQTGEHSAQVHAVLEEQRTKRQQQATPTSGPELAGMMKVGSRVMRGVDWKWGDQVMRHVSPEVLRVQNS